MTIEKDTVSSTENLGLWPESRIMRADMKGTSFSLIRMFAAIQVLYGHVNGHLEINMPRVISQLIGGYFTAFLFF